MPILEAVKPAVIVEIGAANGTNTKNILEFCAQHGGYCHIIDPELPGNYEEIRPQLEKLGQMHQDISLQALRDISADAYLIDGDHNWFTVYHELITIENTTMDSGRKFPVLIFHDILWPYGRRDMYYAVDRILEQYVHSACVP